jgi:hypothetical protein
MMLVTAHVCNQRRLPSARTFALFRQLKSWSDRSRTRLHEKLCRYLVAGKYRRHKDVVIVGQVLNACVQRRNSVSSLLLPFQSTANERVDNGSAKVECGV